MADLGMAERLLRRDRAIVVVSLAVIVVIAGSYTVLGIGMPMSASQTTLMVAGGTMGMVMEPADWTAGYAILVFFMWWVMMVAMMLPSAAPTVLLYTALTRRTTIESCAPASLAAAFVSGYLAVWAVFSVVATGLQGALELRGLMSPAMMTLTSSVMAGVVLLAAGVYQLSSIKRACLQHCRSPMQFLAERRQPGLFGAFRMGLEHGAFCVGCCWFLMAMLFVGGIMNLFWITGLAVYVAIEKLAPAGGRFATTSAIVLAIAGVVVLARTIV